MKKAPEIPRMHFLDFYLSISKNSKTRVNVKPACIQKSNLQGPEFPQSILSRSFCG